MIFKTVIFMFSFSPCDGTAEEVEGNIGSIDKRNVKSVEDISGYHNDN